MKSRLLCLVAALSCCSASLANDGWFAATGAAQPFGKRHPDIRMQAEDIRIEMRELEAIVDVRFTFKNYGSAQQVTMGFPEAYGGPMKRGLENFQSWVDGKQVVTRRKVFSADTEERLWRAVWLKDVSFNARQTRQVRVRYSANYSGDTSGNYSLRYVLRTGSTWRGSIGECRITVDWTRMKSLSKPEFHLFDSDARPVEWEPIGFRQRRAVRRDFTPRDDLNLTLLEGFWSFAINGQRVEQGSRGAGPLRGDGRDPLIDVKNIGRFFGRRVHSAMNRAFIDEWGHPVVEGFGGRFEVKNGHLVFDSMKSRPLRRGERRFKDERWGEGRLVYLRDVVEALGGRFTYNPQAERVDIHFPK
jgi:hypothetical protein